MPANEQPNIALAFLRKAFYLRFMASKPNVTKAIIRAVAIVGSAKEVARKGGITTGALDLARRENHCGPKIAMAVERATDGLVSKSDLCPSFFPPEGKSIGTNISRPRKNAARKAETPTLRSRAKGATHG